jgi:hypothetical protein
MVAEMSNFNINNLNRDYTFKTEQYFRRGWEIFRQNIWEFIIFSFSIIVIVKISAVLLSHSGINITLIDSLDIINPFTLHSIFYAVLFGGIYSVAFKIIQNRTIVCRDFLWGLKLKNFFSILFVDFFRKLLIVLMSLPGLVALSLVFISGGLGLLPLWAFRGMPLWAVVFYGVSNLWKLIGIIPFILPGIYLAVSYIFCVPFVVEKSLHPWVALNASRKVIDKKWFSFLGFGFFLFLLNLVGAVTFGFGLVMTIPLSSCIITAAFADIVGLNGTAVNPANNIRVG